MEDYFSRWVVFHAKGASSRKLTLNGYLLLLFLLLYRFSWARIITNATAEEIALHLYDLCLGLALVPNTIQTEFLIHFIVVWKPQNQHGICSGCRRTVMMWITWRCKICTNLLCYECYHAIMCGTVKHHCSGGEVNYDQINFEKGI